MPKFPPPTPGFGLIPEAWDFPEARAFAANGGDLWTLDILQKLTPWERLTVGLSATNLREMLKAAGQAELAEFVRVL